MTGEESSAPHVHTYIRQVSMMVRVVLRLPLVPGFTNGPTGLPFFTFERAASIRACWCSDEAAAAIFVDNRFRSVASAAASVASRMRAFQVVKTGR